MPGRLTTCGVGFSHFLPFTEGGFSVSVIVFPVQVLGFSVFVLFRISRSISSRSFFSFGDNTLSSIIFT